jgi:hypothetical protein
MKDVAVNRQLRRSSIEFCFSFELSVQNSLRSPLSPASRPFINPMLNAPFGSTLPVRQAVGECPVFAQSGRRCSVFERRHFPLSRSVLPERIDSTFWDRVAAHAGAFDTPQPYGVFPQSPPSVPVYAKGPRRTRRFFATVSLACRR